MYCLRFRCARHRAANAVRYFGSPLCAAQDFASVRQKGRQPLIYLCACVIPDAFLPRVVELATSSSDRQTKVAACELLHALVLYMLGRGAMQPGGRQAVAPLTPLYRKVFPALMRLACDVEQVGSGSSLNALSRRVPVEIGALCVIAVPSSQCQLCCQGNNRATGHKVPDHLFVPVYLVDNASGFVSPSTVLFSPRKLQHTTQLATKEGKHRIIQNSLNLVARRRFPGSCSSRSCCS